MVKLIGVSIVVTGVIFTSLIISQKLINRVVFWEQFVSYLTMLKTKIRYNSSNVYNLLNVDSSQNMICGLIEDCKAEMSEMSYYNAWSKAINKIPNQVGLTKDDKEIINQFGKSLGTTDLEGQIVHCKLYIDLSNDRLSKAKKEKEKNVKLYRTMGVAIAVCLFILII